VMLMALYLHLGPFSKHVIAEIDRRIAELDDMQPVSLTGSPALAHPGYVERLPPAAM
jgi:hypothetical protein